MKVTVFFLLSILSLNVFPNVYFCNYKDSQRGEVEGKSIFTKLDTGVLVKHDNGNERTFDIVKEDDEILIFNYINHWIDKKGKKLFSSIDLRMINKKENIYTNYIMGDKHPEIKLEYGLSLFDGTCLKDD
jgi:hypothetical protein